MKVFRFALACCLISPAVSLADFNAYENSRHTLGGSNKPGVVAPYSLKWIGQALNLSTASPSRSITGVDAGFYFEGIRQFNAGEVRLRVRVYDTFTPSSSLVFSNLVSEEVVLSQTAFTGAAPGFSPARYPVGLSPNTPYWKFKIPVTVSSLGPIGIAYTFETLSGGVWSSDPGLYAIGYGSLAGPTVGSTAMTQGTGVFRTSIASANPGNFAPSEYENPTFADPGAFGGMDVRVWTAVPSPSGFALFIATSAFASRRKRF
ncbi:MAG: hypothetical protein KF691_06725 [Phycisphaeraceae bacterium]|nr:hypothetical protein [Phycisphaeraceae bacterium]